MAAFRLPGKGRAAEFIAPINAGAELPRPVFSLSFASLTASTTYTFKKKMSAAGRLRHFSGYLNSLNSAASVTIDIKKSGTSVLDATFTLAADTVKELEGLATGGTASGYFNTDTSAHRTALMYEDGDTLTITITVAAGGNPSSVIIDLLADEQQPKT